MVFLRKAKKFAVVLALIGSLITACRKELPKDRYNLIKAKTEIVERSLKKGEIDKEANKELVKTLYKLYKEGYKLKGLDFPRDFNEGIELLDQFHRVADSHLNEFLTYYDNDIGGELDISIDVKYSGLGKYENLIDFLVLMKKIFGFMPEDEKMMVLAILKKDLKNTEIIMRKNPQGLDFPTEFDFNNGDMQGQIRKKKIIEALNRLIKKVEKL